MRSIAVLAVLALAGCSRPTADVRKENGYNLAYYRKVAVPSFIDRKGQGAAVAGSLRARLEALPQGVCDPKAVQAVLGEAAKADSGRLGLEQLERLRAEAGADAIVLGSMAPDWSSATVFVYETDLGDQMLRAVVHPADKTHKAFATPDEAAGEVVYALTGKR